MTKLRNRTVLLTYCSSPLGYSFAVQLAQKGANLVLWDADARLAERIANEITRLYGVTATAAQVDVRVKQEVDAAAGRLASAHEGRVSVVVHACDSLGQQRGQAFASKSPEQIAELLEVHVLSSFWLIKALLPSILETKQGGHFVFLSSSTTFMGATSGIVDYAAGKYALVGLARGVQFELDRLNCEGDGGSGARKVQVTTVQAPLEHSKKAASAATGGTPKPERGWITADQIAVRTILAIKRNKREVVLPSELGFLRALCLLLPQSWGDTLLEKLKYARASKSAAQIQ